MMLEMEHKVNSLKKTSLGTTKTSDGSTQTLTHVAFAICKIETAIARVTRTKVFEPAPKTNNNHIDSIYIAEK